jgi:hypothetical protein
MDTLRFILDVSASIKFSQFLTKLHDNRANNFNIKSLAAGVRINKRWTSSIGLSPYSNVGYNIKDGEGSIYDGSEDGYFSGSGGLNKFYWANACEIFRGFSIGATASYLFGNFNHYEESAAFSITTTHNVNEIVFDFGTLYSHRFGEHTRIAVGGIYNLKTNMSVQRSKIVSDNVSIRGNERLPDLESYVPEGYGAGFSIFRNKKNAEWIFAADYQFQNWSVNPTRHKILTYSDSHIYSAGLQITPNTKRPDKYMQIMRYQLGARYNKSYLKVEGYQLEDYSVSLGVGLPFSSQGRRTVSYVNISVNAGESGTGKPGGITEKYILLSVNLSLIDNWLAKRQWD